MCMGEIARYDRRSVYRISFVDMNTGIAASCLLCCGREVTRKPIEPDCNVKRDVGQGVGQAN
jgi:hypothetical protein